MLEQLTADQTKRMMIAVCDRIIREMPCLTRLDSPIGDADHGIGMSRGMKAARENLIEEKDIITINRIFEIVGRSMISTMGGSSGVVFGTMFAGAVKNMEPAEYLSGDLFVKMMAEALRAVQKRGKANPGDKTMVDALAPAVRAMEGTQGTQRGTQGDSPFVSQFMEEVMRTQGDGPFVSQFMEEVMGKNDSSSQTSRSSDLVFLFQTASEAACAGAKATKAMIARHGHAKSLGARALGHPDPGAVSVYFIFDAMCKEAENISKEIDG